MKYIVNIGYNYFEFTTGYAAIEFAETAIKTKTEDIDVSVSLKYEKPEPAKEEEDDF